MTPFNKATHRQTASPAPSVKESTILPKWLDPNLEFSANASVDTNSETGADRTASRAHQKNSFRLEDDVFLWVKRVSERISPSDNPYSPPWCDQPALKFVSEFYRAHQDSQHLLKPIADKHAPTANYLKSLTKRLNSLQQLIIATSPWAELVPNCRVALSDEDLICSPSALPLSDTNTPLTEGELLHLKLVLFPSLAHICLFGRITHRACDQSGSVTITFEHRHESEQQVLTKHILHKQIEIRRKEKGIAPENH